MGLSKNFGKPEGLLGRCLLHGMNAGHGAISKWGLSHFDWKENSDALDIGCGGGMNLRRMLELSPRGRISGIDISVASVKKSQQLNAEHLNGRCEILLAGVEQIPYDDHTFDVITAFEAIYFWQDLPSCLREICRVLRPGGMFMVVCERSDPDCLWGRLIQGIHVYIPEELEALFSQAGFENIQVDRAVHKSWVCVSGRNPE